MVHETPTAIAPYYVTNAPNADITLATGPLTLSQDHASEALPDGAASFDWLPHAGVSVRATNMRFRLGKARVSASGVSIKGDFAIVRAGSRGVEAIAENDVCINRTSSRSPSIDHADIHVLNLPHIAGDEVCQGTRTIFGRASWEFGGWRMVMDPVFYPKGADEATKALQGNLITHVVRASRSDGKAFREKHLTRLIDELHMALSFAFGDHVGPMLTVGRNKTGVAVLEVLKNDYPCYGWRPRLGPAPRYSGIGSMMQSLGTIFTNPDETVREVVWWYLEACWSMVEAGVVLSQAGLERLAYQYLVKTDALLQDEAYDRLTAADNIRLMMRVLGIPTSASGQKLDIPALITVARNRQVHPKRTGPRVEARDVHVHCLQTIELLVLRLAGYGGAYHPRAAKHAGDELRVPWVMPQRPQSSP